MEDGDAVPSPTRPVRDPVRDAEGHAVTLRERVAHDVAERDRVSLTDTVTLWDALGEEL